MIDHSGVIPQILGSVSFDFVDDRFIQDSARIAAAHSRSTEPLHGGRAAQRRACAAQDLPGTGVLRIRAGGSLIATDGSRRCRRVLEEQAETAEVRAISQRLFDGPAAHALLVQEQEAGLAAALGKLRNPDVLLSPAAPAIGFVHRTTGFAEVLLPGQHGERRPAHAGHLPGARSRAGMVGCLRRRHSSRALSGSRERRRYRRARSPALRIPIPGVLAGPVARARPSRPPLPGSPIRWTSALAGKSASATTRRRWSSPNCAPGPTIPDPVLFRPGYLPENRAGGPRISCGPESASISTLERARPSPDDARRRPGTRAWLESPVREAAVVSVNGQRAGFGVAPALPIDVTRFLRRATTIWRLWLPISRLTSWLGARPLDYSALIRKYGRRFDAQGYERPPALAIRNCSGPVRLIAEAAIP